MSEAQDSGAATNEAAESQNDNANAGAAQAGAAEAQNAGQGNLAEGKENADDAGKKDEGGDKSTKSEVPEKYEFKVPEGVELDPVRVAEFENVAKTLQLSQEQAQRLVDLAATREVQLQEQHLETVKGWGEEVAKDKVLGKPENQAIARRAIDTFGGAELKQYLESTGLGNHPLLVKWAYEVGKATSEDGFVGGREGNATAPKSPEDILYGKKD